MSIDLKTGLVVCGTFAAGWLLSEKYTNLCVGNGLKKIDEAGFIKWLDGNGNEISIEEATKLVKDHFNVK